MPSIFERFRNLFASRGKVLSDGPGLTLEAAVDSLRAEGHLNPADNYDADGKKRSLDDLLMLGNDRWVDDPSPVPTPAPPTPAPRPSPAPVADEQAAEISELKLQIAGLSRDGAQVVTLQATINRQASEISALGDQVRNFQPTLTAMASERDTARAGEEKAVKRLGLLEGMAGVRGLSLDAVPAALAQPETAASYEAQLRATRDPHERGRIVSEFTEAVKSGRIKPT